jgi:hypothetical protein
MNYNTILATGGEQCQLPQSPEFEYSEVFRPMSEAELKGMHTALHVDARPYVWLTMLCNLQGFLGSHVACTQQITLS